ncbi:MAG: hypothetical protein NVS3B2_06160 [Ramlibacter sp.]
MDPIRQCVMGMSSLALLLAVAGCERTITRAAPHSAAGMQAPAPSASDPTRTAGAAAAVDMKGAVGSAPAADVVVQLKDSTIAAKVTTGLAADRNLRVLKIGVDSQAGIVTLRGLAPSNAAKERAEEIARDVMGVTGVRNQLTVQAG